LAGKIPSKQQNLIAEKPLKVKKKEAKSDKGRETLSVKREM